jgi:polyisoprenyl-teichoic acid--peptidoglycan teichoic acid transferase
MIIILGIIFGTALLITAILTFMIVRDTVRAWGDGDNKDIAGLNLLAPATPVPTLPPDMVLQTVPGPDPVPWDGQSRMNILFIGLDYRDWAVGEGPPRSDTMILLTIDPATKSAGMLSIPRDLYVNIPGFNYGKINTAYYLGEAYQVPGGGPALAMQTVENFLGVDIPYYAQVDFGTFVRLIDEIGGVPIDVPEEIQIDLLGDGSSTIKTLDVGPQTLPGEWALAYARNRDTAEGDFDRAERQQQVILGVREQLLDFDMIPMLIAKAPLLYRELSDGINTNLTFDQLVRLGWIGKDVNPDMIRRGVIGPEHTEIGTSPEGLWILIPKIELIRTVRDEIFSSDGPIVPVSDQGGVDEASLVAEEAAQISVRNGTYVAGLAALTGDFLANNNLNIVDISNADQVYNQTTITDYTGNPYTLQKLTELMGADTGQIISSYDPDSPFDIVIVLGQDWVENNTLP